MDQKKSWRYQESNLGLFGHNEVYLPPYYSTILEWKLACLLVVKVTYIFHIEAEKYCILDLHSQLLSYIYQYTPITSLCRPNLPI